MTNADNIQDRTTGVVTTYDADFNALGIVNSLGFSDLAPADYIIFREEGKYGIKDAAGNVTVPPIYKYISMSYDGVYAVVDGDNGTGLVNASTGELAVVAEYESVVRMSCLPQTPEGTYGYEAFGYYCVSIDGKIGYVNADGVITCEPRYAKNEISNSGVSFLHTSSDGSKRIVTADGIETDVSGYNTVNAFNFGSGIFYKVTDESGSHGVIDWHGSEIMPCEYMNITMSGDGRYLLATKDYTNYSLYQLDYPLGDSAEVPEEAAAPEEAETDSEIGVLGGIGDLFGDNPFGTGNNEETSSEEIPVEEPSVEEIPDEEPSQSGSADYSSEIGMLNSVIVLLNDDPFANGGAAISLLDIVYGTLQNNSDVASLIESSISLLNIDPAANASAVISLINTVIALLQ